MSHFVIQVEWILAVCGLAVLIIGVVVNGLYMLVSPRAWYRLPHWFRASGGLPEERYSHGWGAIQMRLVGGTFLAVTAWVLYDVLSKHR